MSKRLLTLCLIALVFLLGACRAQDASKETFTIAYLPQEGDAEVQQLNDDFEKKLSEALGMDVEAYQATSYNATIEAMRNGKADLAMYGPFSYLVAVERANADVLAMLDRNDSSDRVPSVIAVAKDSPIETLEDLKGKTIGFADPVSTTGHLLPKAMLIDELGVSVEELEQDGQFFKSVQFAGGHDKALLGVVRGQYDAAGVGSVTPDLLIEKGIIDEGDIRIIGEAEPMMSLGAPYAVRGDLPDELKQNVKDFLFSYENESYFKNILGTTEASFVDVDDAHFDELRDIAKLLKLSPEQLLE